MLIRRPALLLAATALAVVGPGVLASTAAFAQSAEVPAEVKECATQYLAAKANDKWVYQPWQDFFADCKAKLPAAAAAPAPAAGAPMEAAPAPKPEAAKAEPAKAEPAATPAADAKSPVVSPEKKCEAEWQAKAAALKKHEPKLTLAKFLKRCVAHGEGGMH